ncbi:MAG: hypothetical protein HFG05_05930 [Oscillibacter sp.]|nr:hypothetical protein [Oscillibacter sp.]
METLLIPALLDRHWPLLRWAFETGKRHAVVLDEEGTAVEELGLRHMHNDLCYPFLLITGQVLAALRSGRYDPESTSVLISQAADGCRGSCLIRLLRPVLNREGFSQVKLLSLNAGGLESGCALGVTPALALRAVAAAFWGDALMLLENQTRPYEAHRGETDRLAAGWRILLSKDLQKYRHLSPWGMLRRCREMAADFRAVPREAREAQKTAVVGELYTKYCGLGNWNLQAYLEGQGCEVGVNGLTWYALYYMDTHLGESPLLVRWVGRALMSWALSFQKAFIKALRKGGFSTLPPYPELRALALPSGCALGCGWLLSAEAAAWVRAGYKKVLAAMPFGCLPGHIYARGIYARLQRELPEGVIVGVDYDASTREGTVKSRIRMLLDMEI